MEQAVTCLPLDGAWELLVGREGLSPLALPAHGWQPASVPGCWEADGVPAAHEGPTFYRHRFHLPDTARGRWLTLTFGAVSYACTVWLNRQRLGDHEGMWDRFDLDATAVARPGEVNEVLLEVWKPGQRYPVREVPAGFLPDVAPIFGGPWQPVGLSLHGQAHIAAIHGEGRVAAQSARCVATLANRAAEARTARLRVQVLSPEGVVLGLREREERLPALGTVEVVLDLPVGMPQRWHLDAPRLYRLEAEVLVDGAVSDAAVAAVGFRELRVDGARLLLNDEPLYPRGALHWGWYPEARCPWATPETIRQEITTLRALGCNLVKHGLYVPVPAYLDLCDELGMLAWQELPLWLPQVTPDLRRRVREQYGRILAQQRGHPSLIVYTLGCELSAEVDSDFLGELDHLVRRHAPGALVRDNSGSAECYGGAPVEHADFYDYHFYADTQFFRDLLDGFGAPRRPLRPWLFGEFNDVDTLRDTASLAASGEAPWWMRPGGVGRSIFYEGDDLPVVSQEARLAALGLAERAPALRQVSRQRALAVRGAVLEMVRQSPRVSGYVLTGLRDSPIATAGLLDDHGQPKWEPAAFRAVNDETVLGLAGGPGRAWEAGGDRYRPPDRFALPGGASARLALTLAHHGRARGPATLRWQAALAGEAPFATGEVALADLQPGFVGEVATFDLAPPVGEAIAPLHLVAELAGAGLVVGRCWRLWRIPPIDLASLATGIAVLDPADHLAGLGGRRLGLLDPVPAEVRLLVATVLAQPHLEWLGRGGQLLLFQTGRDPLPTRPAPFWREALPFLEPGSCLASLPEELLVGIGAYGLATDRVFVREALAEVPWLTAWRPALRRLDTRTCALDEYLIEGRAGAGRLLATTLRPWGGLGDQPRGLGDNHAGRALLAALLQALAGTDSPAAPLLGT